MIVFNRQATLRPHLFAFGFGYNRVYEFDVKVVNLHDGKPSQNANLRSGKPHAVGVEHGFAHVVQKFAELVVEFFNEFALFMQNGIGFLHDKSSCHNFS